MTNNTNRSSDFRHKEVIDVFSGKKLGFISDVDIDLENGRVHSIIIPGKRRLFGILPSDGDIVIPWNSIQKIGDDIILVSTGDKN